MIDVLVNGKPGDVISAQDRGLQFGDGVFETIAVKSGELLCRKAHFDRLEAGLPASIYSLPGQESAGAGGKPAL